MKYSGFGLFFKLLENKNVFDDVSFSTAMSVFSRRQRVRFKEYKTNCLILRAELFLFVIRIHVTYTNHDTFSLINVFFFYFILSFIFTAKI